MLSEIWENSVRFAVLAVLQIMLFDYIDLWNGRAIPQVYILFLLTLPFDLPRWLELFLGLLMGLVIDIFHSTPGLHASACLVLAFLRPLLLKALAPREGYEFGWKPTARQMGLPWYLSYAGILALAHHSVLFFVEVFTLSGMFSTLLRILLSAIFTLSVLLMAQYLAFSAPKR